MKNKPLITIIGKPNVGKSTLFNRIIGEKKSIVSPVEGVTRDRVFGSFDWLGNMYDIIDTGGFIINEDDIINENIKIQLDIAKQDADFIIFVVDGKEEITTNESSTDYSWNSGGYYNVTLIVTDEDGETGEITKMLQLVPEDYSEEGQGNELVDGAEDTSTYNLPVEIFVSSISISFSDIGCVELGGEVSNTN